MNILPATSRRHHPRKSFDQEEAEQEEEEEEEEEVYDDGEDTGFASPPPSAASTTETVSTNDADARRCEEWELFSQFGDASTGRPSSELCRSDASGSSNLSSTTTTSRLWTAESETSSQRVVDDDAEDERQEKSIQRSGGDKNGSDDDEPADDDEQEDDDDELDGSGGCPSHSAQLVDESGDDACTRPTTGETETATTSRSGPPSARSVASSSSCASLPLNDPLLPSSTGFPTPASSPQRIQVFVRVRPPSRGGGAATAGDSEPEDAVTLGDTPAKNTIYVQSTTMGSVTQCTFDRVFAAVASQEDVYSAMERAIAAALDGVNATIFAYGQTGTGKTHTMFGEDGITVEASATPPATDPSFGWGIIPRALRDLLQKAHALVEVSSGENMVATTQISCSFLQIYNDRVFDLLTDRKRQKPLLVREQPASDGAGGMNVVLQGLSSRQITSLSEALELVRLGRSNRSVRETELNAASSRSHAIVQINLTIESKLANGDKRIRTSRLNLVDLAGSEKWNTDVEVEDRHAQELKNINTSLSALGNCIAALAESGRRHIPYRDSTLTRLLQDSFGGNTLAFLIATVSSSQKASEETIRTLQFADRARSVIQVVRVNESFSGSSELLAAKAQIKTLKEKLAHEQKRRHETRLKELEAMQKEFATKLQAKEDDIQRLARDNEVFAKWRAEDVNKIRSLEQQLNDGKALLPRQVVGYRDSPELQGVGDAQDSHGEGGRGDDDDDKASSYREDNNQKATLHGEPRDRDRETQHGQRQSGMVKKASMRQVKESKRYATTTDPHSSSVHVTEKEKEKPRVKSYRSLLEKYALSNNAQKATHHHKQQPQQQPQREPPVQRKAPPPLTSQQKQSVPLRMESRSTWKANEEEPSSRIAYEPNMASSPEKRSTTVMMTESVVPSWTHHQAPSGSPSPSLSSPSSFSPYSSAGSNNTHMPPSLSKAGSLPILTKQPPQPQQPQLQQPQLQQMAGVSSMQFRNPHESSPSNSPSGSSYTENNLYPHQAWQQQLPSVHSYTTTTTTTSAPPLPWYETSAPAAQDACAKHSLKGCVLCAVKDYRIPPPPHQAIMQQTASMPSMKMTPAYGMYSSGEPTRSSSSSSSSSLSAAYDTRPCERHQLPSCFLCTTTTATTTSTATPWKALSSSSSSASSLSPSSFSLPQPAAASQGNSCCTAHMLANCVLCAGLTNTRGPQSMTMAQPQPQPSESPWLRSSANHQQFQFPTVDTVYRIAAPTGGSNKYRPPPQYEQPQTQQYAAPIPPVHASMSGSGSYSSTPSQYQYEPSDPAPYTVNSTNNPSSGGSSSPVVRRNIKELVTDTTTPSGNKKQFNALLREASDAANSVLRHRP